MGAMAAELAKKRDKVTNLGDLEKKIKNRPDKSDLENKNILKSISNWKISNSAAGDPGIQSARESLRKKQAADSLNQKIANRPSPDEVSVKIGPAILKSPSKGTQPPPNQKNWW